MKQKEYVLMLCIVCAHLVLVYIHVLRYNRINDHHCNRGIKADPIKRFEKLYKRTSVS